MKRNGRFASLGLAGILAFAGCAHQYRTDANGVVHEYDCMGYEFTQESEARRQQMLQQNSLNSGDAKALVGLGLWGLGVKRNAPAGAQLGQDIFHAGLQESIAEAGRDNVQQNVNVYNNGLNQEMRQNETQRDLSQTINISLGDPCNFLRENNIDEDIPLQKEHEYLKMLVGLWSSNEKSLVTIPNESFTLNSISQSISTMACEDRVLVTKENGSHDNGNSYNMESVMTWDPKTSRYIAKGIYSDGSVFNADAYFDEKINKWHFLVRTIHPDGVTSSGTSSAELIGNNRMRGRANYSSTSGIKGSSEFVGSKN